MEDRLLGEGGFGCVFQPEIPCVKDIVHLSKKKHHIRQVSKIFTVNDSVQIENAFSKMLYSWDKEGKFFVVPTKLCKTTLPEIRKNSAADLCESLQRVRTRYVSQIVMPYAGEDLLNYLEGHIRTYSTKFSLATWIKLLNNVFIGLQIMHQQGYIHLDIKLDNIIYDGTRARISDFGLSTRRQKVYSNNLQDLSIDYLPYPFEIILTNYKRFALCEEILGCKSLYYEYMKSLYSFGRENAEIFLQYHPIEEVMNEVQKLEKWTLDEASWFEILREQTGKIDVYSVGIMCIDVEKFLDFSTVSKEIQGKYRRFVQMLTTIDFRNRPTMLEAYQFYKQIM